MRKINYNKILYTLMSFLILIFVGYVWFTNIFPFKYIIIIFIIMGLWDLALYFTLVFKTKRKKNRKRKIVGYIISVFLLIIMSIIGYYLINTMKFFKNFGNNTYKEETYIILVNSDSSYQSIQDINNVGYVKQELGNMDKAIEELQNRKNIEMITYEHYNVLMKALMDSEIESLLIEQSYYEMLNETLDYSSYFRILDTISIVTEIVEVIEEVDVSKTPFTVYISGIDTYGSISGVSRSDVNMIVTINPTTKQMLFISIPRDYYVQLHGTTGYKDKLTHAGIYGIDMSISTIEDLLDVDINYYFRVNFSTLEKVVDAIDGVDVYSKYTFNSSHYSGGTYSFVKGYNHLNGKQALCFSRERYNLPNGDRDRGMNQQAVLDGIVRKAISPTIITRYTSILDSLSGSFQTNITESDIQKLIKMQLNDMAKWNITTYSLNGYDGEYEYTYSNPYQKLYVMHPTEETITEGKSLIDKVYDNQMLESSYGEVGNVSTPNEIITPPPVETPEEPEIGEDINNEENSDNEEQNGTSDSEENKTEDIPQEDNQIKPEEPVTPEENPSDEENSGEQNESNDDTEKDENIDSEENETEDTTQDDNQIEDTNQIENNTNEEISSDN